MPNTNGNAPVLDNGLDVVAFVVFANRYDFEERGTGRRIQGVAVHCLFPGLNDEPDRRGYKYQKFTLPVDCWTHVGPTPGWYRLACQIVPAGKSMDVRPYDLHYLSEGLLDMTPPALAPSPASKV